MSSLGNFTEVLEFKVATKRWLMGLANIFITSEYRKKSFPEHGKYHFTGPCINFF